jgi:hypothetical protein
MPQHFEEQLPNGVKLPFRKFDGYPPEGPGF